MNEIDCVHVLERAARIRGCAYGRDQSIASRQVRGSLAESGRSGLLIIRIEKSRVYLSIGLHYVLYITESNIWLDG
ncbi:hypothetical protein CPter291_3695 [Collimonas pratensis]|uniref:Uncharacterized protein n=1 Tax=Collimonas pratensis TaxID=279113 RepID=A0ABM5Z9Y1_9BURK|nr:hypothetical protein CPter291_3695 [Collimonas pratensis]